MDWFERLTGFSEVNYADTLAKLRMDGEVLTSIVNGKSYRAGRFEVLSLGSLREQALLLGDATGQLKVSAISGDVRKMHRDRGNAGALFQVASQFNMLEMVSPHVTPEHGMGRYENDHTQGLACAIAAGAATIYRNYFAPAGGQTGQTAGRQIDGLADIGAALSERLKLPVGDLWTMRNGYALCTETGLAVIDRCLSAMSASDVDFLRDRLKLGVHSNVEVTDAGEGAGQSVSQIFCSALPVAYTSVPARQWASFASLVLEGAYEATLLVGLLNSRHGGSNVVLLTHLGGGAFGNREEWIIHAMRRALQAASGFGLDVRIVSYRHTSASTEALVQEFA